MNKFPLIAALLIAHSTFSYAENQLTVSPSLLHFDYTEFSTTNEVLDRELGWLTGIDARLSHPLSTDWLISGFTAYYGGTVDYDGHTQNGVPHTTTTGTKLLRVGASIERLIYKKTHLFISAQSHRWNRDIQDKGIVSGIDETYRWLEYSIGLKSDIFIDDKNSINLEAGFLITRNASIDVDLSRIDFGSATLDIGDGSGGRLSLSWNRQYEKNASYALGLFFEAWEFGRSNTKTTQGGLSSAFVTEPESETKNIGLQFNIEHRF